MIFAKLDATMKSIAYATNHTLDIQGDVMETSSKDSGKWKDNQITKLGWTATSEHLCSGVGVTDAYGILFQKFVNREPIDIHSTVAENANSDTGMPAGGWTPKAGEGLKGKAYINSLTLNAQDGQNATMSIGLTGSGALVPDATGG